jgi:hypothetical protein
MTQKELHDYHFRVAAELLGCDVAAVKTVNKVEGGRAFLSDGRPVILFEPHVFHRMTVGMYDETDPEISNPVPLYKRGGYGSYAKQWERFEQAARRDESSAIQSASWGAFQVLGQNWHEVGYSSPFHFRRAMEAAVAEHLFAFVRYCQATGAAEALRDHRWGDFALIYNGKDAASVKYAEKLQAAYEGFSSVVE